MRGGALDPRSLPFATPPALDVVELVGGGRGAPISPADAARVARAAVEAGRAAALNWAGRDLEAALAREGVEVRRLAAAPSWAGAGLRLCALMVYDRRRRGERHLDLYLDELGRKRALLAEAGVVVSEGDLEALHLAHEFYHFLELSEGRPTQELVPEVLLQGALGPRRGRPARASEVAAHAFARAVTGVAPHPTLMDALARLGAGELDQTSFERGARKAYEAVAALDTQALEER